MTPNPIRKVLSSIRKHQVRHLLMGGQACVLYGAAEFSRDIDLALFFAPENLESLKQALIELQALVIAVPPFEPDYLKRGHAVHFRCHHPDCKGMRIDVMTRLRGVDEFSLLWARRTTIEIPGEDAIEVMSLPDLIQAKKTQRDKDWPMIRRLVESHFFENRDNPDSQKVSFWLNELRTPPLLLETLALKDFQPTALKPSRLWLLSAENHDETVIGKKLKEEEEQEREMDRGYWLPLKVELEALRRQSRKNPPG